MKNARRAKGEEQYSYAEMRSNNMNDQIKTTCEKMNSQADSALKITRELRTNLRNALITTIENSLQKFDLETLYMVEKALLNVISGKVKDETSLPL
jgi:uncharacterized protein YpiB (UPF0302 family)